MKQVYFWIMAGDEINGLIFTSTKAAKTFLKQLSHADKQGAQVVPFEPEQLKAMLSATQAKIFVD
jgi:hypothetical protein